MQFKLSVSKLANHFFFVSNLAGWNPYCRKEYNELWLRHSPLNKEEKEGLVKLSKVLKTYTLYKLFISSTNPEKTWYKASRLLPKKDLQILRGTLEIFSSRFERLWKKERGNLDKVAKELSTSLTVSKKLLSLIGILYGNSQKTQEVEVFLLTSPITKRVVSGGSGLGKDKIVIECSKIMSKNNERDELARVVLHELIHASFEQKIRKKIQTYIQSNRFIELHAKLLSQLAVYHQVKSFEGPIKEMIAVSLLPEGYIAEKYFGIDIKKNLRKRKSIRNQQLKKNYYDLMLFSVWKLYTIAREYCDNEKVIDRKYLEATVQSWEEFEQADLSKFKV